MNALSYTKPQHYDYYQYNSFASITESAPIERQCSINFYHFLLLTVVIFANFSSKNTVILNKISQKMITETLKCALWRSIQEWRSIGTDTVCLYYKKKLNAPAKIVKILFLILMSIL